MELVDGGDPVDRFARQQRLSLRQVLERMLPVCDAVHHAYARGVLYRDLKPGNIVVTPDGRPKVLDFGLAKAMASAFDADAEQGAAVSIDGEAVGTPAFMSPEQRAGGAVDARADVYALGVILYWRLIDHSARDPLLSKRWVAEGDDAICSRAAGRSINPALEHLLLQALARQPRDVTRRQRSGNARRSSSRGPVALSPALVPRLPVGAAC